MTRKSFIRWDSDDIRFVLDQHSPWNNIRTHYPGSDPKQYCSYFLNLHAHNLALLQDNRRQRVATVCHYLHNKNKCPVQLVPTKLGAAVVAIVWLLDLKLPMQSVPITTNVVSSNLTHCDMYSLQHSEIKFVRDFRKVGGFLRFVPPIQLTAMHDIADILVKVALNTITVTQQSSALQ